MSIDDCYNGVIKKLTDDKKIEPLSKKLLSLTKNDERVLYVYETLESLNAFPSILKVSKSEAMSTNYRNLGNKCYQRKDNYMALQYYNLSLLHAPLEAEAYSVSLANRSAVLFSLKAYSECIKDIELVFTLKFPEKLRGKLNNRKEMCLGKVPHNKTTANVENPDITKLLTPEFNNDPQYVCASSKLKVVCSPEMGRHVVAKEDIKVGEILVQEDPYFVLLLKSQCLLSCSYCISRDMNLTPCNNCCYALYCSEECKKKAWADYHAVECSLMATLIDMKFTKLEWLGLRTVIKARNDHADWKGLFQTIKEAEQNAESEFRGHVKINDKWVYDSKYYTSIHMLASNIEKRSISDIFLKSVTAAVFLKLLESTEFLKADNNEEKIKIKQCVAGTLLHHIMTSPTNMHGISGTKQDLIGNYVEETSLASAPYAFHSLINHSCAPNVVRFSKLGTGKMTLFALRPIKKGMQIFDNYGSHHALQSYLERQSSLKFQYKFTCLCEACMNQWPTYFSMLPAKYLPPEIKNKKDALLSEGNIQKLQKGDLKVAAKLFKPLCELAELLEPYAPCVELANCQETLKQCLQIFGGLLPYFVEVACDAKSS